MPLFSWLLSSSRLRLRLLLSRHDYATFSLIFDAIFLLLHAILIRFFADSSLFVFHFRCFYFSRVSITPRADIFRCFDVFLFLPLSLRHSLFRQVDDAFVAAAAIFYAATLRHYCRASAIAYATAAFHDHFALFSHMLY